MIMALIEKIGMSVGIYFINSLFSLPYYHCSIIVMVHYIMFFCFDFCYVFFVFFLLPNKTRDENFANTRIDTSYGDQMMIWRCETSYAKYKYMVQLPFSKCKLNYIIV